MAAPDPMAVYNAAKQLGGYFDCDDVVHCSGGCGEQWEVGPTYTNSRTQAAVIAEMTDHRKHCSGEYPE